MTAATAVRTSRQASGVRASKSAPADQRHGMTCGAQDVFGERNGVHSVDLRAISVMFPNFLRAAPPFRHLSGQRVLVVGQVAMALVVSKFENHEKVGT